MAAVTTPGQRLAAAAKSGDHAGVVEAAYDLGEAAAFHAIRAAGKIPSQWPGALEVANAKVDELLTRFQVGQPDQQLPQNPAAYVFASVRRAVSDYMDATTAQEAPVEEIELAGEDDDFDDVRFAPLLMAQLVAAGDHEAANVLAVARDLAARGERPTARSIQAELAARHTAAGDRTGPDRWRVDKAWTRVRQAARA